MALYQSGNCVTRPQRARPIRQHGARVGGKWKWKGIAMQCGMPLLRGVAALDQSRPSRGLPPFSDPMIWVIECLEPQPYSIPDRRDKVRRRRSCGVGRFAESPHFSSIPPYVYSAYALDAATVWMQPCVQEPAPRDRKVQPTFYPRTNHDQSVCRKPWKRWPHVCMEILLTRPTHPACNSAYRPILRRLLYISTIHIERGRAAQCRVA